MADHLELTGARRALLEKYLQGENAKRLAQTLRQQHESNSTGSRSTLLTLNHRGSKRPFFLLHGDYLSHPPLWCMGVAQDLGPDQPLCLQEPMKLEDRLAPTLEEMAATHLAEVRALQPEGPYQLGGWCNGALVAFEMAQQLHAAGQQVDLLVLIEPYVFFRRNKVAHDALRRIGEWTGLGADRQLDWFVRLDRWYVRLGHVYQRLLAEGRQVRQLLRAAPGRNPSALTRSGYATLRSTMGAAMARGKSILHRRHEGPAEPREVDTMPRPRLRPREDYRYIFDWMAMKYQVRSYSGPITVFRSCEALREAHATQIGFCRVARAVELHLLTGDMMTSRTDWVHIHEMGAKLRQCLRSAQGASSPDMQPSAS